MRVTTQGAKERQLNRLQLEHRRQMSARVFKHIINLNSVCSYIARYPVHRTAQSALHFTPWQTCSFQGHLNFFGKYSATLQLLREGYSFTYAPLSVATWGDQTCQRFEATAVGFETGFSRLRVRPSNRYAIAPNSLLEANNSEKSMWWIWFFIKQIISRNQYEAPVRVCLNYLQLSGFWQANSSKGPYF